MLASEVPKNSLSEDGTEVENVDQEEDYKTNVVCSSVRDENLLDFDYRSAADWMSDDTEDGSENELNDDEIIFEKNLNERYEKSLSTQVKIGDLYEPESCEILSELALSMESVCLSTKKQV